MSSTHQITDAEKQMPFIRDLTNFLSAIGDDGTEGNPSMIYNAETWRARGERYGNEESVRYTITMDGSVLGNVLNTRGEIAWINRLTNIWHKLLERHGLWYALGYQWTCHIYDVAKATLAGAR